MKGDPVITTRPHAPAQELLLKATLLEGPEAVEAWMHWCALAHPEELDEDSRRLLPLLYNALRRRGTSGPWMERLERIYRRTWYDNTLLFHAATTVVRAFHDAGIKTMLLKGPALVLGYYRNAGLRPMDDFDILVPTDQGAAAIEVLKGLGWTPVFESVGVAVGEALATGHAYPFRNADGRAVDLHWHVFYQRIDSAADRDFWAAGRPVNLSGVRTQSLSPEDQLLHVCVHAMERAWWGGERRPNLRWAADAALILRAEAERFDWDRLVDQAQRLRFVMPMREALGYLHDLLGIPVPQAALARIRTAPVPMAERIAEHARTQSSRRWGPWLALGVCYLEYSSSLPPDAGFVRRLAGLPSFLRRRWGSGPVWTLPFVAAFRGVRRIGWMWQHLPAASPAGGRGDPGNDGPRPSTE